MVVEEQSAVQLEAKTLRSAGIRQKSGGQGKDGAASRCKCSSGHPVHSVSSPSSHKRTRKSKEVCTISSALELETTWTTSLRYFHEPLGGPPIFGDHFACSHSLQSILPQMPMMTLFPPCVPSSSSSQTVWFFPCLIQRIWIGTSMYNQPEHCLHCFGIWTELHLLIILYRLLWERVCSIHNSRRKRASKNKTEYHLCRCEVVICVFLSFSWCLLE